MKTVGVYSRQSFIGASMHTRVPATNPPLLYVLSFWYTATVPATVLSAIQRSRAFAMCGGAAA